MFPVYYPPCGFTKQKCVIFLHERLSLTCFLAITNLKRFRSLFLSTYSFVYTEKNSNPIFLNNLGIIYLEKAQNNKATRFFQESIAKHESAEAYNNLGLMYLYGRGCDRNCIKAKHLFEKAIEIDNSA